MKSKLIIGDINSIFIKSLIEELKRSYPNTRVDCLSTTKPRIPVESIDHTYANHISYWWTRRIGTLGRIGWFLGVVWWFLFRVHKVKYDVVQLHFVGSMHSLPFMLYKWSSSKVAAILWGSDIFRCERKGALRYMLTNSDIINCTTNELYQAVSDLLGEHVVQQKKITHNVFGLSILDDIKQALHYPEPRKEALNILGISDEWQQIVVVGHNASEGQQHLEIIRSLCKEDFEHILFIFPMTYGGNPEYKAKVLQALNQSNLHYLVKDEYMKNEDVAALRVACDVFIQLQITDGLSGSMQEHLFARNTVITGAWLPYATLLDLGVMFLRCEQVSDIGATLKRELNSPSISSEEKEKNYSTIYGLSSWQSVVKHWHEI